jgi:prepilin-type N-terminal cleavage/methylation domain-containing protein
MSMKRRAFTLVELVVVVLILGILAAVAAPKLMSTSQWTAQIAFVSELNTFVDACYLFKARTGSYPEDSKCGAFGLDGFNDYVREKDWAAGTPVGGKWDVEVNEHGVANCIGVHFHGDTQPDDYMLGIVAACDDGDLATGSFRKLADKRFYFVLQE